MGRVRFTSKLVSKWLPGTTADLDRAVLQMAVDIDRGAKILAPRETGALANSGRIEKNGTANYSVIFGGSRVPYARRRHYENRKNPGTLKYLERSGDAVSRNVKRYVK